LCPTADYLTVKISVVSCFIQAWNFVSLPERTQGEDARKRGEEEDMWTPEKVTGDCRIFDELRNSYF